MTVKKCYLNRIIFVLRCD